ncbi:MAG: hypothetical protein J3R72DRAFT_58560 [Linnemannia gamsii]|nr:MAG: hypothetical protein J3R72DRAFT_58560 [Linnemannia gamsii]
MLTQPLHFSFVIFFNVLIGNCASRLTGFSHTLSMALSTKTWLFAWVIVAAIVVLCQGATQLPESCPECKQVDAFLSKCNTALHMETWPGTRQYQPTAEAAACQCNLVVYNQTASCMTCQSSTSAKYSVIDLPGYKNLCTFFGQKDFPDFPIPASSSTTSQPALPTGSDLPSEGGKGGSGSSHSSLSSGAVAGMYAFFVCCYHPNAYCPLIIVIIDAHTVPFHASPDNKYISNAYLRHNVAQMIIIALSRLLH